MATDLLVDFATIAREIAQDIFEVDQIVSLHRLSDEEWTKIQTHPRFVAILADMQREWNSAANTRERVRIKAATGLESQLEVFIGDINDQRLPLSQRVEAGRFLARLAELDGASRDHAPAGGAVTINIVTGSDREPVSITSKPIIDIDHER